MTERKIGDVFIAEDGVTLITIAGNGDCSAGTGPKTVKCYWTGDRASVCDKRGCYATEREDKTWVVFIRRDKYLAARLAGEV